MDWGAVASVGLGGAIGSILRYLVTLAAFQRFGLVFPVGTFAVNLVGSYLIGVVAELAVTGAGGISREMRTFIVVGVLGGFTTFSSFSYDTLALVRNGSLPIAFAYAIGSVVLALAATLAGILSARLVVLH